MYSNNILHFQEYDNFKCPYEKSLETYRMHLVDHCGLFNAKAIYVEEQ